MNERSREARIQEVGREIFTAAAGAAPRRYRSEWWQQRLLDWLMRDEWLRVQFFRFVDVLPSLSRSPAVAAHLQEYLLDDAHRLPAALALALRLGTPGSVTERAATFALRRNVRHMARRFIAGERAAEALGTIERLRVSGRSFTLDVLGEATTGEQRADAYAQRYLALLDALSAAAQRWPRVAAIDDGATGPLPRLSVSLKLSALDSQFDPLAPARSLAAVGARLRPIARRARACGASLYVDMEQYAYKDLVLAVFMSIFGEPEFRDCADVGIVLQAYLRDSARDLEQLLAWVRGRGSPIMVRLVKGAYWDAEVAQAAQRGWPLPVFAHKVETDAAFERLAAVLLTQRGLIRPALGSHNIRSLAAAVALAEEQGWSPREYEFQMLLGMGEPVQQALVARGLHVRVYAPFGELIPGMGYLIRRLLENTSNDSFLRLSFSEHVPIDALLAAPVPAAQAPAAACAAGTPAAEAAPAAFAGEPLTDFRLGAQRAAMQAAIDAVRAQLGRSYPLQIEGRAMETQAALESVDPSHPATLVGRVARAAAAHVEAAVAAARRAWPAWRDAGVAERAALLRRLAAALRRQRFELAAWVLVEAGKPWREADADVAEAIDYCEFYAREAERLQAAPRRRDVPGEDNALLYVPRGVVAVIAPWNFPLAILTGMTSAALATGNAVVVKPAEQTPVVAAQLAALLTDAGVPPGVATFLPGMGDDVGAALVAHPGVAAVAFTGSRAVGLEIMATAAQVRPDQRMVKRVVAEMGGKNAIIVDADADLDEAVRGVVLSTFGYAGQKCSACARVVVVADVHAAFVERLIDATRSLRVGAAEDPATFVGPLIDAAAQERVRGWIERGRREATLACAVDAVPADGYFVGPAIFDAVPPTAALAQEEIFGPVLAVIVASDFEAALAIANDCPYGLTGGVYSRSPAHVARARRALDVGNLYVNRPITGALVDRQPFGGCKLSGVGSKAGGPDYVAQFCEPRTVTENTIRHGLVPAARRLHP